VGHQDAANRLASLIYRETGRKGDRPAYVALYLAGGPYAQAFAKLAATGFRLRWESSPSPAKAKGNRSPEAMRPRYSDYNPVEAYSSRIHFARDLENLEPFSIKSRIRLLIFFKLRNQSRDEFDS
jgi:hypothetical protein